MDLHFLWQCQKAINREKAVETGEISISRRPWKRSSDLHTKQSGRIWKNINKRNDALYAGYIGLWESVTEFKAWLATESPGKGDRLQILLLPGDPILYKISELSFVPSEIFHLFATITRDRSYMPGVCVYKSVGDGNKFSAQITANQRTQYLGSFDTELEAHLRWAESRLEKIRELQKNGSLLKLNSRIQAWVKRWEAHFEKCIKEKKEIKLTLRGECDYATL